MASSHAKLVKDLANSRKILDAITSRVYNDSIYSVAMALWERHLSVKNPQWKYLSFRTFHIIKGQETAHVMAFTDTRLPGIGMVGYFGATSVSIGAEVLEKACQWHKKNGLSRVYGPINGTLPSDYRLNSKDDYLIPGEPVNPIWYKESFRLAGFTVFNRYVSGRIKRFDIVLKFAFRKAPKLEGTLRVRKFNDNEYDKDFYTYHVLRNKIFPHMSIYCPAISLAERRYISPGKFDTNYTFFLMDGSRAIGFVMAYVHHGSLIIKTIAVLPEYRGRGLSRILAKVVHDKAASHGIKTAVYAMVREGNQVYANRHLLARVIRRYCTMYRVL